MDIGSESEAREHVASILQEPEIKQTLLGVFADSVSEASVYSRNNWAVTCDDGRVRLQVGHVIICTLEGGRVWMALDKGLLENTRRRPRVESTEEWQWDDSVYPEYSSIGSRNGYYSPSGRHGEVWPEIRRLHFESIYRAATGPSMHADTKKRHCSGALKYLRNVLDRHVPDPLYSD